MPFYLGSGTITKLSSYIPLHYEFVSITEVLISVPRGPHLSPSMHTVREQIPAHNTNQQTKGKLKKYIPVQPEIDDLSSLSH